MMDSQEFWEDSLQETVKCENGSEEEVVFRLCETSLNFSSSPGADDSLRRGKPQRQDPMSHRIIEKRRRDRMNNCLADLSRLIPPDYLKKGRGRIEKTEIIEMAIRHLKYLQERVNCMDQRENNPISPNNFQLGYQECLSEVMRYLVEGQGHFPSENICVHIINHLQRHCDKVMRGDILNKPRSNPESSSSSGSSSTYLMTNQSTHNGQSCTGNISDTKKRLHQHSNIYSNGGDKTFDVIVDMDRSRLGESPGGTGNETQSVYSQQNSTQSFTGLKLPESNVDEGGGTAFARKTLLDINEKAENDRQLISNTYSQLSSSYLQALHRLHPDADLRCIRKCDSLLPGDSGLSVTSATTDTDNIHSYKFKNTIKQRFSQSQSQSTDYRSSSPSDGAQNNACFSSADHVPARRDHFHHIGKSSHKRRKTNNGYAHNQYKDQMSSSETNSSENISSVSQNCAYRSGKLLQTDMKNNSAGNDIKIVQSMTNTKKAVKSCDRPGTFGENYSSKMSGVGVPIFALHAKGSFYVPMNVDYDSLLPFLGPYDLLDASSLQPSISLHPVTISVNFQPMFFDNKPQLQIVRTKSERKDWQ